MKRNLLSIIILALMVVNIVLSAIMMVSVSSASRKTAQLVADISAVLGIEINGLPQSDVPGEDGSSHYAVGNVSLSMNTKHEDFATYSETMTDREGLIKDIIFSVMANYTMDEAKISSTQIKKEILSEVQELFGSDFIYAVSYNFLYN